MHLLAWAAVVALLGVVACSPAAPPPSAPPPASTAAATRPAGAAAAPARPALSQTTVRFAIPVSSGLQVLPQLAQEAGYFAAEGLEVEIGQIPGSPDVIAALTSGGIDMANSDSPSVIQSHTNGAPVIIVAVPVTKPIFDFMVAPNVTRPEDLRGQTIGVTRICDSTCFQISRALQSWGLRPQQDVQLLGLRDYPGMFAALTNKQVVGSPLAPPFNFQAQKQGFHSFADLSQLPIDYPTAVVQTTQSFAAAHPDTVEAFLRAYTRAIQRYKTDQPFTVEVYKRFLKSDDTQVIVQTWDYYQRLLRSEPTPTAEGIRFVLDSLVEQGEARYATANPAEFMAPEFMERVLASRS